MNNTNEGNRLVSKLCAFEAFHVLEQCYTIQSLKNGSKLLYLTNMEIDDLIEFLNELKNE